MLEILVLLDGLVGGTLGPWEVLFCAVLWCVDAILQGARVRVYGTRNGR